MQQGGIVGLQRLNPDLTWAPGAAGAAGDLHDELRGTFRGLEVGAQESGIRIERGHERDVWKVVSLGKHLGADQNRRGAAADQAQLLFQPALAARGVAVDAVQRQVWEPLLECSLGALGAGADGDQVCGCRTRDRAEGAGERAPQ